MAHGSTQAQPWQITRITTILRKNNNRKKNTRQSISTHDNIKIKSQKKKNKNKKKKKGDTCENSHTSTNHSTTKQQNNKRTKEQNEKHSKIIIDTLILVTKTQIKCKIKKI